MIILYLLMCCFNEKRWEELPESPVFWCTLNISSYYGLCFYYEPHPALQTSHIPGRRSRPRKPMKVHGAKTNRLIDQGQGRCSQVDSFGRGRLPDAFDDHLDHWVAPVIYSRIKAARTAYAVNTGMNVDVALTVLIDPVAC